MRNSTFARSRVLAVAGGAGLVGIALVLAACGQLLGIAGWVDVGADAAPDASGPGDGGTSRDAPSGGDSGSTNDAATNDGPSCASPVAGGAQGIYIPPVGGAPGYCIDATETTMALFNRFLDDPTINPPKGAPPECAWNTGYAFEYDNPYGSDVDASDYPVTAVNWCDAWGFCNYWGKHLCGNRTDGGAVDPSQAASSSSEWEYACAGVNGDTFPYGNNYEPNVCRTGLSFSAGAGPVPIATCIGGFPGLYDMSGNLEEWEDSCIPSSDGDPQWDRCLLRGGTYFFPEASDTCQSYDLNDRNGGDAGGSGAVTIRCCWEP